MTFEGSQLTYGQLDRHANRLAPRLRDLGVTRGDRVGIRLDRSLELVVALLGVLKAGAAYVPIDPAAQRARQSQIAELASLSVLLTAGDDGPGPGVPLREAVTLDGAGADSGPAVDVEPGDPAYVLSPPGPRVTRSA